MPDMFPASCGDTPVREADGTGELPGHAGTDHLDRVQSTAPSNAICERIIGTLRRELLDRLLIVNEHHLRRVRAEYLRHYNSGRESCWP
jgi:Integrase core domain